MISRAEIKQQAKEQLKGNLGMIVLCGVIYFAITFVVALIPYVGSIASIFIAAPIYLGLIMVLLNVTYGEKPEVGTLFTPFSNCFGTSIITNLLVGIYTLGWTLLLIIPGLVKQYSYAMTFYILAENPNMTANEAITESRQIMDGHKFELFVLQLSFIPWLLLCCVTFGIAYIYVIPYMSLTMTNFYHNIKRQQETVASEYQAVEAADIVEE